MMRGSISDAGLYINASLDGNNRTMDENREQMNLLTAEKFEIYILTYL